MRVGAILLRGLGEGAARGQRGERGQRDARAEPRKKWRRLKLACRSAASCGQVFHYSVGHRGMCAWVRIFWNGADSMTPINSAEKRPSLASSRFTISVDGFHVVVLRAPPGRVGQQLARQRAVELLAVVADEDTLELASRC